MTDAVMTIETPGLMTSIQDFGRPDQRYRGVARGGAADPQSMALANYCVGNNPDTPVLECTLNGPSLEIEQPCVIAFAGAPMAMTVNDETVPRLTRRFVDCGDKLVIGASAKGARGYLAMHGGFEARSFLGSKATHFAAQSGGYLGRALAKGDQLCKDHYSDGMRSAEASIADARLDHAVAALIAPIPGDSAVIRVCAGPDMMTMTEPQRQGLTRLIERQAFSVLPASDRMGVRLTLAEDYDFAQSDAVFETVPVSGPVYPGTVQWPPGGSPIILGCDAQGTGGYLRFLQVIEADLSIVGQLRPGVQLWFRFVTLAEAIEVMRVKRALQKAVLGYGVA